MENQQTQSQDISQEPLHSQQHSVVPGQRQENLLQSQGLPEHNSTHRGSSELDQQNTPQLLHSSKQTSDTQHEPRTMVHDASHSGPSAQDQQSRKDQGTSHIRSYQPMPLEQQGLILPNRHWCPQTRSLSANLFAYTQLKERGCADNLPKLAERASVYQPGRCAKRVTHYMYRKQHRPEDNNIYFWRSLVKEFFAPNAKERLCVSSYTSRQEMDIFFPQEAWHCEICNTKPGRGFEITAEALPRLFKIKYDSGILQELLYVDMPTENETGFGHIILHYSKATLESVFEHVRIVHDGQLRIIFTSDLKILSWEFCSRHHEEFIPRRILNPQASQIEAAARICQASAGNLSFMPPQDIQSGCDVFAASTRELANVMDVPVVKSLGIAKRYLRCIQISGIVNTMKDLVDFSIKSGLGPIESMIKFPSSSTGTKVQIDEPGQQQQGQLPQPHVDTSVPGENESMECDIGISRTPGKPLQGGSEDMQPMPQGDGINSHEPNRMLYVEPDMPGLDEFLFG